MNDVVTLRWVDEDHHRALLVVTLVAMALAGALAVVGLPPVSIHGPPHWVGIMDPLCGMTRAVRALARGDLAAAWRFNPGSFLLAGFAALMITRAAIGWSTLRWLEISLSRPRVLNALVLVVVAVLWLNQQLQVERLT